jgi:PhnB protein
MVKPIPEGYHSVTPYLILNAAGDAIAFYKRALGAAEVMRMDDPSGKIHHAEISIGNSRIMLADEHPEIQALSPKTIGGSPVPQRGSDDGRDPPTRRGGGELMLKSGRHSAK